MVKLLELSDGRKLWIDGNGISQKDTLYIAQKLFDTFGLHGPRIKRKLMYEVEPAIFMECPHTESPEMALEMAKEEEKLAKKR